MNTNFIQYRLNDNYYHWYFDQVSDEAVDNPNIKLSRKEINELTYPQITRYYANRGFHPSYETLVIAAEKGYLNMIKFLIEGKYTLPLSIALYHAATNGHLEIVEYLFDKGARVDILTVPTAAGRGHAEVVKFLLSKNVRVSSEAMNRAVLNGYIDIVKLLINVEPKSPIAIDLAITNNNYRIAKLLIENDY